MTHPLLLLARSNGNPVIEGGRATMVWEGRSAPRLMNDICRWEEDPQKLTRIAPGLWAYSIELDPSAYLEYSFTNPKTAERMADPLNQNITPDGFGHFNHFFYMPAAHPTPLMEKHKGVPGGRVTRHWVDLGMIDEEGRRELYLYQPPVREKVPLLLVYDGVDYLQRARLNLLVDNLIYQKRIRPIAMAFLQNGGKNRAVEYACSDATLMTVEHSILPFAAQKLNLVDVQKNRGAYGVLGASFGGLMAMYTGLRMPDIFGRVISQSGVFESDGRDFAAVDLIRARQSRELKIWMDIGRYDWLLEDNRRLQPLLQENGYRVTYREFAGGHNFPCWRDEVWRALEDIFPDSPAGTVSTAPG